MAVTTTVKDFQRLLETHDWCYRYSDDPKAYARGQENEKRIQAIAATDPELQAMLGNHPQGGNRAHL